MINELAKQVHQNAKDHGFFDKEKNIGETLCLIHSEKKINIMNQSKIEKRQPEPLMNNEQKVQDNYEHYLDEFCDADCKLKSCNPDAIFNWFKNKIPKLPTVDEAGVASVRIIETIEPQLSEQEQAFFIAGFQECIKWLSVNAR